MAEKGFFFNSIEGDIREYQASDFANYFSKFIPNGIFNNEDGLKVTADGTGMAVKVGTGAAFVEGYMYENTEPLNLEHSIADPTYDRKDLVVIRLDRNQGVRNIYATIIQGTPAPNPQSPQLIDDGFIKDLPIAEVLIKAGQSTISQSQITDKRGVLIDPYGREIVEHGSNVNGYYIRFADGTQICYHNIQLGSRRANGDGTYENPYRTSGVTWVFPASFLGGTSPLVIGTGSIDHENSLARANSISTPPASNTFVQNLQAVMMTSNTANVNVTAKVLAIGRWKE